MVELLFLDQFTGSITIPAESTVSNEELSIYQSGAWYSWILTVNEDGLVEKIVKYYTDNGGGSSILGIQDLIFTQDGGYIATGGSGSGSGIRIEAEFTANGKEIYVAGGRLGFLYKFNQDGLIEWIKTTKENVCYQSIIEGQKGEYFTVGYKEKNNINTAIITKTQEKVLYPEMPLTQKIIARNEKIKYQITGRVEGTGGTIVIGDNKEREIVNHGEDSVDDIIITPEEGYQIKSIKINGENYPFTPEIDGSLTMPKFINVLQNKDIVVTFSKLVETANVVVYHNLWENGTVTTIKLAQDETITGEVGEEYITSPKIDLEKYEIITNGDYYGEELPEGLNAEDYYIPENASGNIEGEITVRYYYKEKTYTLTIHHYLDGTQTSIAPDTKKTEIAMNTEYSSKVEKTEDSKYNLTTTLNNNEESQLLEIDNKRYKVISIEGEESGIITSNREIIYYYNDTAFDITVEKIWEDNENSQNTRPENITIKLLQNDEEFQSKVINVASGETTCIFDTLYKYDENEKEIKYTVKEDVPDGYYVKNIVKEDNKYTITNARLGSITINKVDNKTKAPLEGAEFAIEKQTEDSVWEIERTITTDENGQAKVDRLEQGKYRVTETKAPDGYNLNTKAQEVEINESSINIILTVENKAKAILPLAGGGGIYLLPIIGIGIMILGFIIIKINKYKEGKEKENEQAKDN